MDAYDIFKKLTKGLKFKTPPAFKTKQDSKPLEIKKEEIEIKNEVLSDDEEDRVASNNGSSNSEDSDSEQDHSANDHELQLLEGVENPIKRKKDKKIEKSEDLKKKLELEEQNHFRNIHGIKAVGRHIPPALKDFADLQTRYNLSEAMVNVVKECGYTEPTPVQRQALPCMLEDRQILAIAPTGSGKTAAFLIPIMHSLSAPAGGPRALVLCPTRELAVQIYREALRLSAGTELRCSIVRKMQESKMKERESTFKKSDIVISTPNRLCYLLNQESVNIKLDKIRWLVIDEADKLFEGSSEQASDFRQQIEQILSACEHKSRRIAMFSATHTARVAQWSRRHMKGLININVGHRNTATNMVDQELLFCGNESGKLIAFRQLVQKGLNPPVLVFVQSKDRAKQLFKELIYDGINVDVIHADRTQTQRDNVVRSFRIGKIWVLICTELMGRGMDFHGVNLVVNYDFPPSAIAYIHRVGRAGRAGRRGRAVTFFTQDDVANLRSIAAVMKQSGCQVPEYMLKLKKDANARKKLLKRAPRRDNISTVLEKKALKRKADDDKVTPNTKVDKSKTTEKVPNSKHKKLRKIDQNTKPGKVRNNNVDNKKKINKKQGNNKLKKKERQPFISKKIKNKK